LCTVSDYQAVYWKRSEHTEFQLPNATQRKETTGFSWEDAIEKNLKEIR
jgi:hypothetical protein